MFDKWGLERNPFYTRPIEKTSIRDFSAREKEVQNLQIFSKTGEGVVVIIGEPGVGSTSLANYARFSNMNTCTIKYELKMENMNEGSDILKSLIYSLAQEVINNKYKSKFARSILNKFIPDPSTFTFNVQALGVGVKAKSFDNVAALYDIFQCLMQDCLKGTKKDYFIFQLNNMNIHAPGCQDRIHLIIEQLRDILQTPKTLWYLLGDNGLERLIKEQIPRVGSIVKHWLYLEPMEPSDFRKIYRKRIENSGQNAVSPFTEDAIEHLCIASHGRVRFAFDVAGSLLQKYADQILPEKINLELIKKEAEEKIGFIVGRNNFAPRTREVLQYIVEHPSVNSTDLSKGVGIQGGNLTKSVNVLIKAGLVEKIIQGKTAKHFPVGLSKLLKK